MNDKEIGKSLLDRDAGMSAGAADARQMAGNILRQERGRIRLLAGLAILLWLVAAAGVFFVIYVAAWHIFPKQQQLMRSATLGNLPAERIVAIQSVHFHAIELCTRVIAAAFVALTLAALCTVLLVLISRQATLRQIHNQLSIISEQLKRLETSAADQSPGPPR